jgi:starch-binding outer membrane protein, SusD/RagB family
MKINIFKFSLILFSLTIISCEDILEVKPKSSITEQIFWTEEGDFYPYMTGIYARYRSHIDYMGFGEDRSEMWTVGYNARYTPYYQHNITPGNTQQWISYYGTIGHVNLLLEKIEPFTFSNSEAKSRIMAEAYAMRAAMYFFLSRIWGDVPLVLNSVKDENEPLYPRSPVSEIFNQINSDIEKAINLFPENNYRNKYRWSKPAVYALLADVKMWSATVLGGGTNDFNAAIAAISEVEKSGVQLLENYGDIFDNSKNDEIIISFYLDRSEYSSGQYTLALLRYDTSGGADNVEELPISLTGQQGYAISSIGIDIIEAYAPDDKRIPRTRIPEIYDGEISKYWPNKFRGTQYSDTRIADSDIILYRYSDMLLLKAEAYAALNQPENALLYLNKVRGRAKIPEYTDTNKASLQKEILDERGRELFHEIKRWYDLRRAHAMGIIDVYNYVPNLKGKTTPLYWAVHVNMLARNEKLVQTEGY